MEDLIRRSDAIDAVRVAYFDKDIQSAKDDPCIVDAMTDWAIRQIKSLSSADRPQGEWIYTNDPLRLDDEWACNRCGNISFVRTNFCDRCGARMKGADNDNL